MELVAERLPPESADALMTPALMDRRSAGLRYAFMDVETLGLADFKQTVDRRDRPVVADGSQQAVRPVPEVAAVRRDLLERFQVAVRDDERELAAPERVAQAVLHPKESTPPRPDLR